MERYLKILGLSNNATKGEIKEAYYTKIKALHPDKVHGTSLEDTANFFLTEINEAYEMLMSQFDNTQSAANQTGCIEEEIFIEGLGQLSYSLSSDLSEITKSILKKSGKDNLNIDGIEWMLNCRLSENVKKAMNKYDVDYSMTMYYEEQVLIVVINRRVGDKWYYIVLDDEPKKEYFEEEILLDGRDQLLKYALSNNLDNIQYAIYEKTGYRLNLEIETPILNLHLSPLVKNLMNKYDVNYSMTTYINGLNRKIIINRRMGDKWFIIPFTEIAGKLYRTEALREIERKKKQAYDKHQKHQSDINNMYAEIESRQRRTDTTLKILGGIWNILKDAGRIG